ncbi:UNVERIFIED_CONTAM: hypothetical protein FKN15_000407 [Acipenser sinensis]
MRRNSPCWFCLPNPWERQCQCNTLFGVSSEDRPTLHSQDVNLHCMSHPAHHTAALLPDIQLVTTELGEDVSLHCTNRTQSEIMFETWKIRNTNGAECQIAVRFDQTDANSTCEDRITIQNRSENRPFLHVSHFNNADEGNYTCNSAYNGGMDTVQFNVSIIYNGTKPPAESAWFRRTPRTEVHN